MTVWSMKDRVKENYSVLKYVNKHIVPCVHYKGSNRPLKESSPIICPFHSETEPSFYYHAQKNRFKCFGCGVGGDVIDLHIYWSAKNGRKIDFKQAVTELYDELNQDYI